MYWMVDIQSDCDGGGNCGCPRVASSQRIVPGLRSTFELWNSFLYHFVMTEKSQESGKKKSNWQLVLAK